MRLAFLLCLPLALSAAGPPVRESISLSAVTLNRLVLRPAPAREAGLLPAKTNQLPLSVQLYLRPSGQLNHLAGPVQKAAAQVRRKVAPGASQKDRLRDSALMARAVWDWLDSSLPLDPMVDWHSRPATDRRLAWPRSSEIISHGKADADGRALAAVALLRALGVPARTAWARGHLTVQYWTALKPVSGKGKPPLGWWALLDPDLHEAEIDAWSLEPGVLARMAWRPQQELRAPGDGWERVVFAQGDSLAARAAFDAAMERGHLGLPAAEALSPAAGVTTEGEAPGVSAGALSPTAALAPQAGLSLSVAAQAALEGLTQGTATLWVLTAVRVRLESDGAMATMDPVDLLTPYRPHLASWGRELPGPVREMEMEAQGLWSDRPGRLRLLRDKPRDVWQSPPPALGVQHYLSFGVRRFRSVLQAQREGDRVSGILLRADNLSPRADWELSVTPQGVSFSTQTLRTGGDGRFEAALSADEAGAQWVEISTPKEDQLLWNGDRQRLMKP